MDLESQMVVPDKLGSRTRQEAVPEGAGPELASLRRELASVKEATEELETKVRKLRADRDKWQRQADSLERKLLDTKAQSRLGVSPTELKINLLATLAFIVLVAAIVVMT